MQAKQYKNLIWLIIGLGALLRIYHFFDNRSLWEDEIYLSTGLVKLSLAELFTKTLDYQQKAPIGYAVMVKICLMVFGNTEKALRLFPLLCGIASLPLFWGVAERFFKPVGVVVAVTLLAFSPTLLYHQVEAKQYGVELSATVLLLWLYTRYHDQTDVGSLIKWAVAGAVVVWFSYSSIFICAGIAFTVAVPVLLKKQWGLLIKLIFIFGAWIVSFGINYMIFTQKDAHSGWLVQFFVSHDAFIPISGAAIKWLAFHFVSFFNYPMGLSWIKVYASGSVLLQMLQRMVFVPMFFSVAGLVYLYLNNRKLLLLIIATLGMVLLASAIKQYPFHERLTVFLSPLLILLVAGGCQWIFRPTAKKQLWRVALVLMLLFGPLKNTIAQAIDPNLFGDYKKSWQREELTYIDQHIQPGDLVYVYWNDLPGYRYYKKYAPLKFTAIEGKDRRFEARSFEEYFAKVDSDLAVLKGHKRVWVVQHRGIDIVTGEYVGDPAYYYKYNDGPKRFYDHITKMGKEVDRFKLPDGRDQDVITRLMDFSAAK